MYNNTILLILLTITGILSTNMGTGDLGLGTVVVGNLRLIATSYAYLLKQSPIPSPQSLYMVKYAL